MEPPFRVDSRSRVGNGKSADLLFVVRLAAVQPRTAGPNGPAGLPSARELLFFSGPVHFRFPPASHWVFINVFRGGANPDSFLRSDSISRSGGKTSIHPIRNVSNRFRSIL